jgi:hypothetical protein
MIFSKYKRYIPNESERLQVYNDGSGDSVYIIKMAEKFKIEKYLKWIEPKEFMVIIREIEEERGRMIRTAAMYLVVAIFVAWMLGYDSCRLRAIDLIDSIDTCSGVNDNPCIDGVNKKTIKRYLTPFRSPWY